MNNFKVLEHEKDAKAKAEEEEGSVMTGEKMEKTKAKKKTAERTSLKGSQPPSKVP